MSRVLVAGGAGFIGSHMADLLIQNNYEVVVADNLVTGRLQNIAQLENSPHFTFIDVDVCGNLGDHPEMQGKFDYVLNLASPATPSDFLRIPLEILTVGSQGTRNLLHIALRDEAVFFLASTSEVYGDPLIHPQPESYNGNVSSIGPRSCYDESKRFSEALTMAYHRKYGLPVRIARIFNTYGERMRPDDGRVVNTFVSQALRGEPITLHGNGDQTRSFCHVSDEVLGLFSLMESSINTPVNIGNPTEVSMRSLAELIISITGSTSEIISVPMPTERDGDPEQRCPDITLAKSLLNWEPAISLEDGLVRMIDHFKRNETL